jgi:predicted permease
MGSLFQDLRYGYRTLAKNPGFAAVAILTLALGIGANTALFSAVNGVLLNPLPYPHPEQLVTLHESKPNFETGAIPYLNFVDWQNQNHTFSSIAISRTANFTLTGMGEAERLQGDWVSASFFQTLGVKPVIGRDFTPENDQFGAGPVALISAALRKRKFGSALDVLGKSITLDGKSYTVIGVMPASLDLRLYSFRPGDVYAPIHQWSNPALRNRYAALGLHGIGRMKPGVTLAQAKADLQSIARNLAAAYPGPNRDMTASIIPLKQELVGGIRPYLLALLAAVGFVLLIACVNVANLLLARSTGRTREFAIRAALGAGQARVIRQLLTESVLLAVAGGALGLLLASWGTQAALAKLPTALPRASEIGIDARVLIFTAAVSLLAGILFGLAPALRTSRPDLHETLKEGGRGASGTRHRAHGVFVVVEMAMAVVLLIGAGLMIRSLARIWGVDPGFDPHNVLTFSLSLPPSLNAASPAAQRAAFLAFDDKLESTPGIEAVSLSWGGLPMWGEDDQQFWHDGQPKPLSASEMNWTLDYIVEPDYFKLMRIPLERGRLFTAQDDDHSPLVIVIDDVFAGKFFPNQNPVGKRVNLASSGKKAEIIGVVGHVNEWGLDSDQTNPLRAEMYLPFRQMPDDQFSGPSGADVVLRSVAVPAGVIGPIRHAIQNLSADEVVYGFETMDNIVSSSVAERRFSMILLGAFAGLALILASVGIYGVISYLAGQRTHEIGVRMALGAQRRDVLRLILGQGAGMALIGVATGLAAAFALTRLMAKYSLLFRVSATDPLTFACVAALLTLVALAACYLPARRAMRVDPMVALRYE